MEWPGHLFTNRTPNQAPTLSSPHPPSPPLQTPSNNSQTRSTTSLPTTHPPQPTKKENEIDNETAKENKDEGVDLDLHDHMPCGYLCCWTLFLPFAYCAGFLLSPRHKGSKHKGDEKSKGGEGDKKSGGGEKKDGRARGKRVEGKWRREGVEGERRMSRLERLALQKRARIDLMPRVEENSGGGRE